MFDILFRLGAAEVVLVANNDRSGRQIGDERGQIVALVDYAEVDGVFAIVALADSHGQLPVLVKHVGQLANVLRHLLVTILELLANVHGALEAEFGEVFQGEVEIFFFHLPLKVESNAL